MTALALTAACHWAGYEHPTGCGWTAEGPSADRAANKHTRDTGHATTTTGTPLCECGKPFLDTTSGRHNHRLLHGHAGKAV